MVRYKELDRSDARESKDVQQLFVRLAAHDAKLLDPRFEMTSERADKAASDAYLDSGKIILAYVGDKMAGFVALNGEMDDVINALFVAPEHRRLGIAGQLIKELKKLAPFTTLKVETIIGNREAISFYQTAGFIPLTMGLSESGV